MGLEIMKILRRTAQAAGLWLALTAAAFAGEPLKIATSAGPVGQLASFAAKLAKEKGQDVKIVELSDWVALNEVVNSGARRSVRMLNARSIRSSCRNSARSIFASMSSRMSLHSARTRSMSPKRSRAAARASVSDIPSAT